MPSLPVVLTFGESDASGAAGIQADQLAVASMGCHPTSVVTRIGSAEAIEDATFLAIEPDWIEAQAQTVLGNMPVAAFKIGTLASVEQVQPIAAILADYDTVPVVLDPDLQEAPEEDAADLAIAWRELLMPQATVVTLTLMQARRLASLVNEDDDRAASLTAAACAREITGWGAEFVLVLDAEPASPLIVNALFDDSGMVRSFSGPRTDPGSTQWAGAGATLSAALAGLLAQGVDLTEAVHEASQYAAAALMNAFPAGIGVMVPDRLFWAGEDEDPANGNGGDVN
ncbi:MAG TPA: bifunctional hydroxymethylpyrimidine kinase/phosphomethylpyrimidine kinase [Burkholderiaceae bacterium]|nr:bifunctional hydroxymethylpyrimidine kinase/phosphomethylpyrimidine kinase [Burkholderiaceae bacterium]